MKDKKNVLYVIIITTLVIILGVLWFLIISNTNSNSNNSNNNGGPGMNNSSSVTYSAVKEIQIEMLTCTFLNDPGKKETTYFDKESDAFC